MKKVILSNRVCFSFSSLKDVLNQRWVLVGNSPSNCKDYFTFECILSYSPLFSMRISLRRCMQFDFLTGEFEDDVDSFVWGVYRCDYRFDGKRLFIGSRPINLSEIQDLYNRLCSRFNG